MATVDIESVLKEDRTFEPSQAFSAKAHIQSFEEYEKLYRQAEQDPEQAWEYNSTFVAIRH